MCRLRLQNRGDIGDFHHLGGIAHFELNVHASDLADFQPERADACFLEAAGGYRDTVLANRQEEKVVDADSLVVASELILVATLVAVTLAFGTLAPEGSVTVP